MKKTLLLFIFSLSILIGACSKEVQAQSPEEISKEAIQAFIKGELLVTSDVFSDDFKNKMGSNEGRIQYRSATDPNLDFISSGV